MRMKSVIFSEGKTRTNVTTEGTLGVIAELVVLPEAASRGNMTNGGIKDHAEEFKSSRDKGDGKYNQMRFYVHVRTSRVNLIVLSRSWLRI